MTNGDGRGCGKGRGLEGGGGIGVKVSNEFNGINWMANVKHDI